MSQVKVRADDLDFSMVDLESISDKKLLPALARLRENAPVYWSEVNRCWQITRYDDVAAAFQDIRFSNVRMSTFAFRSIDEADREQKIPNLMRYVKDWIVNVDGDTHKRLRAVVTKALSKKYVELAEAAYPVAFRRSDRKSSALARMRLCARYRLFPSRHGYSHTTGSTLGASGKSP